MHQNLRREHVIQMEAIVLNGLRFDIIYPSSLAFSMGLLMVGPYREQLWDACERAYARAAADLILSYRYTGAHMIVGRHTSVRMCASIGHPTQTASG